MTFYTLPVLIPAPLQLSISSYERTESPVNRVIRQRTEFIKCVYLQTTVVRKLRDFLYKHNLMNSRLRVKVISSITSFTDNEICTWISKFNEISFGIQRTRHKFTSFENSSNQILCVSHLVNNLPPINAV